MSSRTPPAIVNATEIETANVLKFGRSFREPAFIGLASAAVLLFLIAAALLFVRHEAGTIIGAIDLVVILATLGTVYLIRRSQFSLEIRPHGFVVLNRSTVREYDDDQLICVALSRRPNYSSGILKSTTRVFDLWLDRGEKPEQVRLATFLAVGADDHLAPFIVRLHAHLFEHAEQLLAAGDSFDGEGWSITNTTLTLTSKRHSQTFNLGDLAVAEIHDDQLCLWLPGAERPEIRIPMTNANTHVLQRLLEQRIRISEAESSSSDSLGRMLVERRTAKTTMILVWLLPILSVLGFAAAAVLAVLHVRPGIGISSVCAVLSAIMWLIALPQAVEFRIYEYGVMHQWLWRRRTMRFDKVDAFTFSAIRQHVKGAYAGTHFALTFSEFVDDKWRKLTFSRMLRNSDPELDQLRDRISERIADRWEHTLKSGQGVLWTAAFRFLPEGLEYRAPGLMGRKDPVLIPYSQIHGYDADSGIFHIWIYGKKKPVARDNVNGPNFYPGYHLLARLLAR